MLLEICWSAARALPGICQRIATELPEKHCIEEPGLNRFLDSLGGYEYVEDKSTEDESAEDES
ncbi:unnamed protein product, partial [marine sediment metagenome]